MNLLLAGPLGSQAVRRLTCRLLSATSNPDLSHAFEDLGKDGLDAFTGVPNQREGSNDDADCINARDSQDNGVGERCRKSSPQSFARKVSEASGDSVVKAAKRELKLVEGRSKVW